jgi:hypothetical protein
LLGWYVWVGGDEARCFFSWRISRVGKTTTSTLQV